MPEKSATDILILPGLFAFLGLLWYGLYWARGRTYERQDKRRWGGLVLLVLAALFGAQYVWALHEPSSGFIYKAQFVGPGSRRVLYAHYAAFIGPLLAIIGVVVTDRLTKTRY